MTILNIILIIIIIASLIFGIFSFVSYNKVALENDRLLDEIDDISNELINGNKPNEFDEITLKMSKILNKTLFIILSDLVNEPDEGTAICRLVDLRNKSINLDQSKYNEIVELDSMIKRNPNRRTMNDIILWLISFLDVYEGKQYLSERASRIYRTKIEKLISKQYRINELMNEDTDNTNELYIVGEYCERNGEQYECTASTDMTIEEEDDYEPINVVNIAKSIFKKNVK